MALQGDLTTLELADIVQNLEMHARTGTLEIDGAHGPRRIYFAGGTLALVATEARPTLVEDLVRAGLVAVDEAESARKRRFRKRKPLVQVLVERGALDEESFRSFAQARLVEDACDVLAAETGAFRFTEEDVPESLFDAGERHAGLTVNARSMLFEAARRSDHWPLIRARVPSDAVHYVAQSRTAPEVEGDRGLAGQLLARLNGVGSVREVMATFPHRRFEAYELLAELVGAQAVRIPSADDIVALAHEQTERDDGRAWRLVLDGLEMNPHHLGLLEAKLALAEKRRDDAQISEALKVIAHLKLESGDRPGARVDLDRAARLAPDDTALGERRLELALADERVDDAIELGLHLAERYRGPGLHAKARAALESLVQVAPGSWELRRELARSQIDCGDTAGAVDALERHAKRLLAREADQEARVVYEEILTLVPQHAKAHETIELIDSRVFEARRARRRRIVRRVASVTLGLPLTAALVLEGAARFAYSHANHEISALELIEERRYAEVAERLESVRARFPYTPTALFDVSARLRDLEAKDTAGVENVESD